MSKIRSAFVFGAAMVVVSVVGVHSAVADEALAKKNNCMACHKADEKVVGPSYKDIAARYKGEAGARDALISKVRQGGSGAWGQMPMPPTTAASDADIATLVDWILAM